MQHSTSYFLVSQLQETCWTLCKHTFLWKTCQGRIEREGSSYLGTCPTSINKTLFISTFLARYLRDTGILVFQLASHLYTCPYLSLHAAFSFHFCQRKKAYWSLDTFLVRSALSFSILDNIKYPSSKQCSRITFMKIFQLNSDYKLLRLPF